MCPLSLGEEEERYCRKACPLLMPLSKAKIVHSVSSRVALSDLARWPKGLCRSPKSTSEPWTRRRRPVGVLFYPKQGRTSGLRRNADPGKGQAMSTSAEPALSEMSCHEVSKGTADRDQGANSCFVASLSRRSITPLENPRGTCSCLSALVLLNRSNLL